MNLARAAALFAVDPAGLGGILVRGPAGPAREDFLRSILDLLQDDAPVRRAPASIADDRLLGGLDLAATLAAGCAVGSRGVLAEADGGALILPMAERVPAETIARICAAMDQKAVEAQREGMRVSAPTRFGVIALDEGVDEERVHPALQDRLALVVACDDARAENSEGFTREDIERARGRLGGVVVPDALVETLVAAAFAIGADSIRAALAAVHAARVNAALEGRMEASEEDAAVAARFVLSPRVRRMPEAESAPEPEDAPPDAADRSNADGEDQQDNDRRNAAGEDDFSGLDETKELVLDAIRSAIPPDVLAKLAAIVQERRSAGPQGKGGQAGRSTRRGRPVGSRAGELRSGARLALLDTLRAAAPRQRLRRKEIAARGDAPDALSPKIIVRREDFRVRQFRPRTLVTTIFVVDASGSAALHRLAEAKGAVQALLAQCYVRRDEVGLIAFRGKGAELLLPPTRSLTRVRRRLSQLPGGGGTPLASGITLALQTALLTRQRGATPVLVFLTDGQANVALDGSGGRLAADADVENAAKALRARGFPSIVIDTSPRPNPNARKLSERLSARYMPLPAADPAKLANAVRAHMPR